MPRYKFKMREFDIPDPRGADLIAIMDETGVWHTFSRWEAEGKLGWGRPIGSNKPYPDKLDDLIAGVCGYKDTNDMAINWKDDTERLFRMLAGENGWAIYCMLKAQADDKINR